MDSIEQERYEDNEGGIGIQADKLVFPDVDVTRIASD